MTFYTYRCLSCDRQWLSQYRGDRLIHISCCDAFPQRQWGFSMHRSMPEHFNHSVGKPIGNRRQFRDALKEKSDEMSERLGFDQHYTEVDPTDKAALGVTDEAIEEKQDPRTTRTYTLSP